MKNEFQNKWVSLCIRFAWCLIPLFMAFLMTMVPFQDPHEREALFLFATALTGGISLYIYHKKIFENKSFWELFPLILFMAICLRLFLFPHESADYNSFLRHWMSRMRTLGWPLQIAIPFTNYNLLYVYVLAALSYIPFPDLYLIKCASVLFDCVLGVTVLFILKNCLNLKDKANLFGFSLIMIIPSLFLNSGMWGQCDSFYSSLLLIGLYLCLRNSPKKGCFLFGLALSTKLQAAFLFPVLLFLVAYRYVYIRHLLLIPIAYIITIVPSILCGRSVVDIINIYFDQMGTYQGLTMGAPTFWALFPNHLYQRLLPVALGMASIIVFVFTFLTLLGGRIKDKTKFWDIAFLYALIVPFVLPKMHERYFYVAVVLAVIYLFRYPKRWLLPLGIVLIDLFAYAPFLLGFSFVEIKWLSIIQLLMTLSVIWFFFEDTKGEVDIDEPDLSKASIKRPWKKGVLYGGYFVLAVAVLALSLFILSFSFTTNRGGLFHVTEKFNSRWIPEKEKIMAKHPSREEGLIKLADQKVVRVSVGDIAEIVRLNDQEMVLRWSPDNEERFVKDPETNVYQFQRKD